MKSIRLTPFTAGMRNHFIAALTFASLALIGARVYAQSPDGKIVLDCGEHGTRIIDKDAMKGSTLTESGSLLGSGNLTITDDYYEWDFSDFRRNSYTGTRVDRSTLKERERFDGHNGDLYSQATQCKLAEKKKPVI